MKTLGFVPPVSNEEQTLIYKKVDDREIPLLFYPPINKVFDRAPVYLIIPGGGYQLVCGDRDIENNTVAVRKYKGGDLGAMSLEAFLEMAVPERDTKAL